MAVPVHLILKDDGGSQIVGSCDVHGRDGSIELRSLQHGVIIPTDPSLVKSLVPVNTVLLTLLKRLTVHRRICLRLLLQARR